MFINQNESLWFPVGPPYICEACGKEILPGDKGYIWQFEPEAYPHLYHISCFQKKGFTPWEKKKK